MLLPTTSTQTHVTMHTLMYYSALELIQALMWDNKAAQQYGMSIRFLLHQRANRLLLRREHLFAPSTVLLFEETPRQMVLPLYCEIQHCVFMFTHRSVDRLEKDTFFTCFCLRKASSCCDV